MEEHNGYTPPASLNLSDFQDAIGDAVVQAIIKKEKENEKQETEFNIIALSLYSIY